MLTTNTGKNLQTRTAMLNIIDEVRATKNIDTDFWGNKALTYWTLYTDAKSIRRDNKTNTWRAIYRYLAPRNLKKGLTAEEIEDIVRLTFEIA